MSIEELRQELDSIDRQLVDLISARQITIKHIAEEKRSTGFPLRDYKREAEVFQGVRARAEQVGVSPQVAERARADAGLANELRAFAARASGIA